MLGGLLKQRVGAGAVGAFQVFELNDGHTGAGGRMQRRRVEHLRGLLSGGADGESSGHEKEREGEGG